MAIAIYFEPENLDARRYAAMNARLCDLDRPAGRPFHAAFHVGGEMHIFDVWDSQEAFEAFGDGVDPGEPRIGEIERIVAHDSSTMERIVSAGTSG